MMASKLRTYFRPKCHPLLLDGNINSAATVRLNVYQVGYPRRPGLINRVPSILLDFEKTMFGDLFYAETGQCMLYEKSRSIVALIDRF